MLSGIGTMSLKQIIKEKCLNKVDYKTSGQAWDAAVYESIVHNCLMVPYKCTWGDHYHLSSRHTIGDASHVPPEHREILKLMSEPDVDN